MADEIKIGHHLLGGNGAELKQWGFEKLSSDPGSPAAGRIWENTSEGRVKWYDGSTVHSMAHLSDVASALTWKGGYNASTNTPNLDSSPTAGTIELGDFYYVTVAGDFYGEAVQIGDALISNQLDPTALAHWTRVQFNVDQSTETVLGIIKIATQVLADAGVDDLTAITPLKMVTFLGNSGYIKKYAVDLNGGAEVTVTRTFAGGQTTFTVLHSLGSVDSIVTVKEIATGDVWTTTVQDVDANTVDVKFIGNKADGLFRFTIAS